MFEAGTIAFYLAEKQGRLWPQDDVRAKYEVAQWVIWQMANQGPKFGERGHLSCMAENAGDQSYAQRRFGDTRPFRRRQPDALIVEKGRP